MSSATALSRLVGTLEEQREHLSQYSVSEMESFLEDIPSIEDVLKIEDKKVHFIYRGREVLANDWLVLYKEIVLLTNLKSDFFHRLVVALVNDVGQSSLERGFKNKAYWVRRINFYIQLIEHSLITKELQKMLLHQILIIFHNRIFMTSLIDECKELDLLKDLSKLNLKHEIVEDLISFNAQYIPDFGVEALLLRRQASDCWQAIFEMSVLLNHESSFSENQRNAILKWTKLMINNLSEERLKKLAIQEKDKPRYYFYSRESKLLGEIKELFRERMKAVNLEKYAVYFH